MHTKPCMSGWVWTDCSIPEGLLMLLFVEFSQRAKRFSRFEINLDADAYD